jgi:hypothetical protein
MESRAEVGGVALRVKTLEEGLIMLAAAFQCRRIAYVLIFGFTAAARVVV